MEIENWYAAVDSDGFIRQLESQIEESDGPNLPMLGEFQYYKLGAFPGWPQQPTHTSKQKWRGEGVQPEWIETTTLADLKAAAIGRTYPDVDKVHFDAVGNRATEYQDAEKAARAFAEAGFIGEADGDVHSFAVNNPTGQVQTDRWAAERIITQADAFRAAQKAMRSVRFKRQAEMRAATTPEELTVAVAAWDSFIAGLRAQLGL